jgi:hypothetical protein
MMRSGQSSLPGSPILEPPRQGQLIRDIFHKLDNRVRRIGEVRLVIAILEDAVRCIERGHGTRNFQMRVQRRDAERWIASRTRGHVFAFENVCGILKLSPEEVRSRIAFWRDRSRTACHT